MPREWVYSVPCASSPGSWAMTTDDSLDDVTGSISDGDPVDWDLAESGAADEDELASIHALRELERVAVGYRILHGSSAPETVQQGDDPGAPGAKIVAKQWGDLAVL